MNKNLPSFTPETEAQLRDSLRRCSPETIAAAVAYRQTRDSGQLPILISGIFERYIEPDLRPRLVEPGHDQLRMIEDLGLDSLTLMEIIMLVEEAGALVIANEELSQLHTLGDVQSFVERRAAGTV